MTLFQAQNWCASLLFAGVTVFSMLGQQSLPSGASSNAPSVQLVSRPPIDEEMNNKLAPGEDPENRMGPPFARHVAGDQRQFWANPIRLRLKDLRWGIPLVGATAAAIAADSWISKQVPDKPGQLKRSKDISNYAAYSLVGLGGSSFLLGRLTRNDHLAETGLLSGEAAINSTGVDYLLKSITRRPRPYQTDGNGAFFQGGTSFASEHSAVAWSIAGVWAHEYPSRLSQTLAYGLASAVTLTRVTARQHFASDAMVGTALGWYFGRQIYRAHHDKELGGTAWGGLLPDNTGEKTRNPENMGSPYVPIDSWVYPMFERLAAMGHVHSAYFGMRPWTRMECARLLEEAAESLQDNAESGGEAQKMYDALAQEFIEERRRLDGASNVGASVDSVYTRFTGISGPPLRDGYHFAQTIINDYGRPYGEGFNNVTGVTAHAVAGPFSVSVQGEYQRAPAVASDPENVLQATASADDTLQLANGTANINRFRLLESSVAFTFRNVQVSFGKQNLWLGPGQAGPFLLSDNAEPLPMLRIDQIQPLRIPGLSRFLGPVRAEFALGRLSGQTWVFSNGQLFGPELSNQPFIHINKISFKPSPNFEFGMGVTVLFGGPDLPFTWTNFLRTFTANGTPGARSDPGDRRSTFDFSYRVPGLREYLTIYADSFVEDEVSPLGSTRPSMRMGLYFPKLPKLSKLDLRAEGIYTDVPGQTAGAGFIYWNGRYRSGYTDNGNLLASWIGRYGKGGQGWGTYWLSRQSKVQFIFRRQVVDRDFLQGGQLNDFGLSCETKLTSAFHFSFGLQQERWQFPVLRPGKNSNVTSWVRMELHPKLSISR